MLKTYSLVIAYDDRDSEQGTYGVTVRAPNDMEAERLARLAMWTEYMESFTSSDDLGEPEFVRPDGQFGGSVLDFSEGAHLLSSRMENCLRAWLAAVEGLTLEGHLRDCVAETQAIIGSIENL